MELTKEFLESMHRKSGSELIDMFGLTQPEADEAINVHVDSVINVINENFAGKPITDGQLCLSLLLTIYKLIAQNTVESKPVKI